MYSLVYKGNVKVHCQVSESTSVSSTYIISAQGKLKILIDVNDLFSADEEDSPDFRILNT